MITSCVKPSFEEGAEKDIPLEQTDPSITELNKEPGDSVSNITQKSYADALFLFEDQILYNRTNKQGIYQIKDGVETILSQKGNLLGLYGSVLLAEDETRQLMLLVLLQSRRT